ncbi:DEKNAAC101724 [Brettanomyces naardenensis]|uniref:DNA damage-binding protein CMR1 n=1 Tax=Brettanomyces naardenensis TaxID=13370 RepID=A0A448YIV9_BRENA|nr:DEKNAAC101724 [Brettanomyces naardenensis]
MGISEFEKQRQQNISRNRELFRKLNLDTLSSDFHRDVPHAENEDEAEERKRRKRSKKSSQARHKKKELEPEKPLRRSRRIAGIKLESSESYIVDKELEQERKEREEKERLKTIRLSGDLMLGDVLNGEGKAGESAKATLDTLSRLGKSFSMGDFYDAVKDKQPADKKTADLRKEFDELSLYDKFHPNDIRLTSQRMTSILFHPSVSRKIVIGGDTMGLMGIWSIDDDTEDEPSISHLKFHGKNIPKFVIRPEEPGEVVSCSYDGSVRVLDLNKTISRSILEFDDAWGDASGISDINFIDSNVCYFTTLGGEFASLDLREKELKNREQLQVLRLHDKKIGSFAVNPNFTKQVATASLDRTLRIWDLRKVGKSAWSEFAHAKSPHCIGSYHSRLSVSTADWNLTNDIVCNGYDNTIRLFQLGDQHTDDPEYVIEPIVEKSEEGMESIPVNLDPTNTLKHNCQTGRWVSILKAKWQSNPRDGVQKFVIGNMNRYFDIFNRNGAQLAHIGHENMTSVPAVACFHRTENWIVGGNASGKAFLFS